MISKITIRDYFLKNFVSKALGVILSKELPESFANFFRNIINELYVSLQTDNELIDNYLRLIINILNESDDTIAFIAAKLLPPILEVFNSSKVKLLYIYIKILI